MRQPYKCSVPVDEASRAALCPVVTFDEIHSPATVNCAVVAADRVQEVSIERQVGHFARPGTCSCQEGNTKRETNLSTVPTHHLTSGVFPPVEMATGKPV